MNQLSMDARALIERVGMADGPGAERRARVKRRLVAALAAAGAGIGGVTSAATASAHAGAAGVALGTATTGKGALTLGTVAVWLAAGAGLGTLVSAPAFVMRLRGAETHAPVAAPPTAPVRPSEQRVEPALLPAAPQAEPALTPASPAAPRPERTERTLPAQAALAAPVSTLADETRLLESAQRELAAGRPAAALALLEEHGRRFPAGALGEERSAARVLSLCALGRTEEAKSAAAAFVARAPHSPLLPRLRGSCALNDSADSASTR